MFYIITTEYVGPNKRDSKNNIIGDSCVAEILSKCPRTNCSNEPRISGWLGTTNDISVTAHGEFDTIEEARDAVKSLGYSEPVDKNEFDCDVIESYVSAAAACDQWDADDWFHNLSSHDDTCAAFGITTKSSDSDIRKAVGSAHDEAFAQNVELHGTEKLFFELRDELRTITA